MATDGTYTGVVDRVEDGVAVVVLEADGEAIEELDLDPGSLPAEARHDGAVCEVVLRDGEVRSIAHDPDRTERRRERAQRRFDRLSRRPDEDRE